MSPARAIIIVTRRKEEAVAVIISAPRTSPIMDIGI
jgi:hypothetical protein